MNDDLFLRENLEQFRNELAEKKIFITGGTGFFGKWFQKSFLAANVDAELTILSRDPELFRKNFPEFNSEKIKYITGDVRDFSFPEGKFDFIIHAATDASAKMIAENPDEIYDVCVNGTKKVLDFAEKCNCNKLLFTSSGAVYGTQEPDLYGIDETHICIPTTAYGKGKYEAEKLCFASPVKSVIARCFAFTGPYLNLDIHYAIGNFIRDGISNRDITVKGDGRAYRSYLYAADLMVWLWNILLRGKNKEIYNVGASKAFSIAETAQLVADQFLHHPKVTIIGKANGQQPPPRYIPDTTKAEKTLNLKQHFQIEESIRRTIGFYA